MKKILGLAVSAALISACAASRPEQIKSPFADSRQGAPIHKLSLALIVPALKVVKRGIPLPNDALVRESVEQTGKVYRDLLGVYYQDFRSVTLVQSLNDPKVAEADIVGRLDVTLTDDAPPLGFWVPFSLITAGLGAIAVPAPRSAAVTIDSSFYSLDHSLIASFKVENREGFSTPIAFSKSLEEVFSQLAQHSSDKLEQPMLASDALKQYANGMDAKIAARAQEASSEDRPAKTFDSDIDRPGYSLDEKSANYAVVVGVENYQNLPPAEFAGRDAKAVRAHLHALGYPAANIILLTDSQATGTKIKSYVESWLPRNVKPDSKVFFYFSGHGAPDSETKQAYLVPWDADSQFLAQTGYPLKRLYQQLNSLKAKEIVVAMDSCFSGAGGHSVLAKGARPLISHIETANASELGKVVVLAAAGGDEITGGEDRQGHGLFTYYLLKGLNEKAGQGTVGQLYDYLKPKVEAAARQSNRNQTPQLVGAGGQLEAQTLR